MDDTNKEHLDDRLELDICHACCDETDRYELKMFGGYCEECSGAFETDEA